MHSIIVAMTVALAGPIWADDLRHVYLVTEDGFEIEIARVAFKNGGAVGPYHVTMTDSAFGEYFVSMRPFRCVPSPEKLWCHVPYPYEIKREVNVREYTDLEYDFMFIWKNANDYGIDMWNGVYYEIEKDGDVLVGEMTQLDMGRLAVPPEVGNLRPVKKTFLDEADPSNHWLPKLIIK